MFRRTLLSLALVLPAAAQNKQQPIQLIHGINGELVYRLTYQEGGEGGIVRVMRDQHRTYVQYAGPRLPFAFSVGPDGKPKDMLNSWVTAYDSGFMVIDGAPKVFYLQIGSSNILVECLGGGKFKEPRLSKEGLGEQR